ncbi:MAG: hypothetical protein HKO02_10140 [Hyphomonadaceae bacterium]|nr:hypothetical protein [Hyphomonadaceae bacterium]
MPRLPHLTFSFLATVFLSQSLAMSAVAADQNTYRPGQAYLKTAANSHEVCAQQCQGDAQCRGWNFVRPNPRTATGICEFNARVATPVRSAISVSGEVMTSVDSLMSRAIPAGTRTRRVGTPTVEARKPATPSKRATEVKRMPVPAPQKSLRPTAHTRPMVATPNAQQSRVYGGSQVPAAGNQQQRSQAAQPGLTPQQQHYRQQFLARQKQQEQMQARQQAALRQQQMQRLQTTPPAMPVPEALRPQPIPQPQMQPQSLYGSLHDDLTKSMTPIERPQTAPDNLANPDAPVATSRAAPAKPVETKPLAGPMVPGLAGPNE